MTSNNKFTPCKLPNRSHVTAQQDEVKSITRALNEIQVISSMNHKA